MRFKKSKTSNTGHSMSETKFTWQRTKSLIFDNFVLSLGIYTWRLCTDHQQQATGNKSIRLIKHTSEVNRFTRNDA
jgi:hypothetical protein